MKKISTLFFGLMALMALPAAASAQESATATFDFTSETIRENIGENMTDVKGFIYNETLTADDVTLQITAGSAPSRIYVDNNRGQNLVTYKDYTTLTFRAPEGKTITKIEFTAAGNSNINNFKASSGAIDGMTWSGNASGVRFQQGGTSYLAKATVTLAGYDTLPAIEYTEVASIAAFNALENGTYAKLTLKDAEITGKSADGYSTVFVQDATGGAWIQYTSLNSRLEEGTKVSGTVYTVRRTASGNPQLKEAEDTPMSELQTEDLAEYTIIEGSTIGEVNVAGNLNRVVKLSGATLEMTNATAGKLTIGEETIDVNNGAENANQQLHKIADWTKGTKLENITIVAILVGKSATANQLLPISVEQAAAWDVEAANIAEFNAAEDGKVVKLALQNARVNAFNSLSNCYYVEDASGATVIKKTSLKAGNALNGYIVGTKGTEDVDYINSPSQGYEYSMTVTDDSHVETATADLVGTPMSIAEACKQENYGKLVTLSNIEIKAVGNGMNKQLTDSEGNTMKARDLLSALGNDYVWPEKAQSITGVVLYYMTGWFLLPISEEAIVAGSTVGIRGLAAGNTNGETVFNLQGIRQEKQQKGLNIVNGQKVLNK